MCLAHQGTNRFSLSLIHHDFWRLIETQVSITDEPLCVRREGLVILVGGEEVRPLLRQPEGDVGRGRDLGDVVAVHLTCGERQIRRKL